MEEVTDEPLYRDRVCGIDIGKAGMAATIRVPSEKIPARRATETRSFATTKRGVLALADWMRAWQVPAAVMEATGDYWKPVFYRLEAEGFECVLADAKQVKNLPGRPKRDPSDSAWLAVCFERGAVTSCFVATPEFRLIRLHTRYRRDLTEERTREKNRTEKLLESAAVKLSSVVTDLHGVTGRDIMDHLIAGERDPKTLAQLARARARRKISELEQALEGAEFFTAVHAALLKAMLDRIDTDLQRLTLVSAEPTGEPLLDATLAQVANEPGARSTASWLDRLRGEGPRIRAEAIARLIERGVLRQEHSRLLWVFESRRYPLLDGKQQQEVKLRIAKLLLSDEIPDARDAMITALAEACGLLRRVFSEQELRRSQGRIRQIVRLDLIGRTVGSAIEELQSLIVVMAGYTGVVA